MRSRPKLLLRGEQRFDVVLVGLRAELQNLDQRRPVGFRNQPTAQRIRARAISAVSVGSTPKLCDSASMAASTLPAASIQRAMSSRFLMASPITSLKVWSAATTMAVASALPSGLSGAAEASQQHVERQPVEQFGGLRLVEHGEARRDIGLERKLMQQPRAEGVDGLHLQAARRLQRRGKQPPRAGAVLRRSPSLPVESLIFCVERVVGQRAPVGERAEHAVGHVGGGGLGEGDAEDLRRIDAAQQQIDDALRQHMRLAGAGIGRDEGRRVRIGGLDLHARVVGTCLAGMSCPGAARLHDALADRPSGVPLAHWARVRDKGWCATSFPSPAGDHS